MVTRESVKRVISQILAREMVDEFRETCDAIEAKINAGNFDLTDMDAELGVRTLDDARTVLATMREFIDHVERF